MVRRFYNQYKQLCADVGVSLASEDDPDKAFAPCTEGIILGIVYDTKDFTWHIREDKITRIVVTIKDLIDSKEATMKEIWSIVGKILNIKELVEPGRHYVGELLRLYVSSEDPAEVVELTDGFKRELNWWLLFVQLCARRSRIPSGYKTPPPNVKTADSDASGGSKEKVGQGVGVVIDEYRWTYLPWPKLFSTNAIADCCGMKWKHKMSFLELVGHVLRVIAFPDTVQDSSVATFIDNNGSCRMSQKGYYVKCAVTDTLLKTVYEVASALNGKEFVIVVTRCSTKGSICADAISKGNFDTFHELMPRHRVDPEKIPIAFVKWLYREGGPVPDYNLGADIIKELKENNVKTLFKKTHLL